MSVRWSLLLSFLGVLCLGFVKDLTTILPVTNDGTQFDRDTWNPTNGSFPAVGASYTDPIFGEVLTRMRAVYPGAGSILSSHNQWNADSTKFFWMDGSASNVQIITTAGTQVETNIPGNFGTNDTSGWSVFNPDLYYYTTTTSDSISQRNIATDTTTVLKDFNLGNLGPLGTSFKGLWVVNPIDDTANPTNQLFLVNIGGVLRLWDQARDVLLTGSASLTDVRWAGLSPDGRWLIRSLVIGGTTYQVFSLPINVLTSTLGTGSAAQTGTNFWDNMCADHGAVVSLTSGKTYLLGGACFLERWHYRIDVTLNQAGRSTTLQAADNTRLWMTDASQQTGNTHYSCAIKGAMQNWCWSSQEDYAETVAAPGTWYANKQEILLINMQTARAYRMAHHRSYPLSGKFGASARVNSSQDGLQAFFLSAMGLAAAEASVGYADVYLLSGRGPAGEKPWSRRPIHATQ